MKLPETTDIKKLIILCSKNDQIAFQELYNNIKDPLFSYVLTRTKNREESLDLVQDIFLDLWKALQNFSYKSDSQFYGFVFIITKRKLSKYYQKKTKEHEIDKETELDNLYDEVSTNDLDNIQITENAIKKLTNKYREVIELRYWSDLPFNNIAKLLKTKEGTIKVRHHRAIKQLKEIIEKNEI